MQSAKSDEGILLVVSGPSGAGKGTICNAIRKIYPDLHYSISMTTRAPRPGEIEGVSYFFRTNEEFEKLIKEDAFLEYACVYDHYYGTPKRKVLDYRFSEAAGKGWRQKRKGKGDRDYGTKHHEI